MRSDRDMSDDATSKCMSADDGSGDALNGGADSTGHYTTNIGSNLVIAGELPHLNAAESRHIIVDGDARPGFIRDIFIVDGRPVRPRHVPWPISKEELQIMVQTLSDVEQSDNGVDVRKRSGYRVLNEAPLLIESKTTSFRVACPRHNTKSMGVFATNWHRLRSAHPRDKSRECKYCLADEGFYGDQKIIKYRFTDEAINEIDTCTHFPFRVDRENFTRINGGADRIFGDTRIPLRCTLPRLIDGLICNTLHEPVPAYSNVRYALQRYRELNAAPQAAEAEYLHLRCKGQCGMKKKNVDKRTPHSDAQEALDMRSDRGAWAIDRASYLGVQHKARIKHRCGFEIIAKPSQLIEGHVQCPVCEKSSPISYVNRELGRLNTWLKLVTNDTLVLDPEREERNSEMFDQQSSRDQGRFFLRVKCSRHGAKAVGFRPIMRAINSFGSTGGGCPDCNNEGRRKYTIGHIYKNWLRPFNLTLSDYPYATENDPTAVGGDIPLRVSCPRHGIVEPISGFDLRKRVELSRRESSRSPCLKCDPSLNELSFERIRQVVEAGSCLSTHFGLFTLIDSEQSIYEKLEKIRGSGEWACKGLEICIETRLNTVDFSAGARKVTSYESFLKGKNPFLVDLGRISAAHYYVGDDVT